MHIAIAIFAKNPDLSPVKTRLAKDIGTEQATAIYRQLVDITHNTVTRYIDQTSDEVTAYWALAEEESCTLPEWQQFKTLWTGPGGENDLGERLHHVYSTLIEQYDAVMLIGSDCPDIKPEHFEQAAAALKEGTDVVIGPAEDGGFWLFASKECVAKNIWLGTVYSCEKTLKSLKENLTRNQRLSIQPLTTLQDIDTIESLSD